jgi:hypothetical protein
MNDEMAQSEVDKVITHELPKLPGWCTVDKAKRMAALARGASLCIELGVFGGRSLVAIALTLRAQESGRVDGIDPYTASAALEGTNDPANDEWWAQLDYKAIENVAEEALYRLGLVQYARLVRMLSRAVVAFYGDETVDLLHQDSNHSEEITCQEVALWAPKIRRGGYWAFDDTNWPTTQKAQVLLLELGFTRMEDHETWAVFQKKAQP